MTDGWVRVDRTPGGGYHTWIDGDEEWGTFHGTDREAALAMICEALAERYYSLPGTTTCDQCGMVRYVE